MKPAPLLALLLLVACVPPVDEGPPPPAPVPSDQLGPYEVGATTLRQLDDRGKFLVIEVWYPAAPTSDDVPVPYEEFTAGDPLYRDVAEDLRGAPYPLVAFSHGFSGIRYQSSFLMTWLASHGFVVAAVDHIGNTLLDLDDDQTSRVAVERPADVAIAVDVVVEQLPHLVDIDLGYAMVGHSFGAWTTLVVAGGVLDSEALFAHCAEQDDPGCRFIDPDDADAMERFDEAAPDPRAKVAVAMAPGVAYSFGPAGEGLAGNAPTLVMGGTADEDMPYEQEIRPVYEALSTDSALASLEDAGHFGFSDLCEFLPLPECDGVDGGWMDIDRVHALTNTLVTAWIRANWLDDADEESFLTQDWVGASGDATWE